MIALLLFIAVDLRDELLDMAKADQEVRARVDWTKLDEADAKAVQKIDRQNAQRLGEIMDQHGWPKISLVGKDGAHAAWLIAQHATHDRKLMKRCLEEMRKLPASEVSAHDLAFLTDRVELADRGKQVYGTQLRIENGKAVLEPIEDEANVDDRRKAIGLEPLANYVARVRNQFER